MNKAYLLLGGNTGDRLHYLETARKRLETGCGRMLKLSSLYETAAWGKEDQPSFLNQVICIETKLSATELLEAALQIEATMGRTREEKYAPRTIDIDILFFNNGIIDLPGLVVPHPHIQNRRFVLEPMVELSPNKIHPVLHQSMKELLKICPDKLEVKRFAG